MKKPISWYKKGKSITVNDKMQKNYTYTLSADYGDLDFKPQLTPMQMLSYGIFEGKYMNDCENEFPSEWYLAAKAKGKLSLVANVQLNYFKIKSRLSLQEWRKRKWIPIAPGDKDVRGWFQWYCRYYIGRRMPEIDAIQIARHKAFIRHKAQIVNSIANMPAAKRPKTRTEIMNHRPKQRQALLQWAWNPFIKS